MSTRDEAPRRGQARDEGYQDAVNRFGHALDRLARAYEADPETRRDLLQDIHFAIWRSFGSYDGRCSLRTWIYRVAHNTATSHITRAFRVRKPRFVTLDELSTEPAVDEPPADQALAHRRTLDRLYALVRQLDPLDRQVIVSYLEGIEASEIAQIVGTSPGAIGMKIHRIKRLLAVQFTEGSHP